jgi:GntR family transcriptional regulator
LASGLGIEIDRQNGVPLYLQVKRQVERFVRAGAWEKGMRLPTERELAKSLHVSRNTISQAYRELEAGGIIFSRQGKGTFISQADHLFQREGRKERLLRVIDMCIEETMSLGFNLDEFITLAQSRAREKKELLNRVKVSFIECNREQLDYFSRELELGAGVAIMPNMLQDLTGQPEKVSGLAEDSDIIVTTFFHLDEVKEMFSGTGKEILGIALDPALESIVRIARLPKGKRAGLVCISNEFADRVKKSIENAGIDIRLAVTVSRDPVELERFVRGFDTLIVSPGRRREAEKAMKKNTEVMEFVYRPDAGSVNLLKSVIMEERGKPLLFGGNEAFDRKSQKAPVS